MTDFQGATWLPNSNYFPDRNGGQARYVIIHGTAGGTSAEAIGNYFASTQNTANPVSSHYIIGTAGEIVQAVLEKDGAWANGALTAGHASFWDASINPNNITISIECCKPATDNSSALTAPQFASLCTLVNDICTRHGIAKRAADASGGITGHFSIDPVNRSDCPGPLAWKALYAALGTSTTTPAPPTQEEDVVTVIELDTPGVSQFWAPSANGAWRCTAPGHDHLMLGNIRSFYVRFGNQGLNGVTYLGLPLTDMFSPKSGTYAQAFERGVVVDDTSRVIDHAVGLPSTEHCYLAHLDSGFGQVLLAQPIATPLQNQIKSLNAQLTAAKTANADPAQIAALEAQLKTAQSESSTYQAIIQQAIALLQK